MGSIVFVLQVQGGARQGMEDPAPADPPRIFWKSRRSGACYPGSYLKILLISSAFLPKESSSRDSSILICFFPLLENWLISVRFFPANFSNSVQKKITQVVEQVDSHLNTGNLGYFASLYNHFYLGTRTFFLSIHKFRY